MSIASDAGIFELIVTKRLRIVPFSFSNVQPSSVDLTLDDMLKVPVAGSASTLRIGLDEISEDSYKNVQASGYILEPGKFVLGQLHEKITMPKDYCGYISNRSSIARLGINVNAAQYINPGYEGNLPIIIHNFGNICFEMLPFIRICQLSLHKVEPVPIRDYSQRRDVKYFGESGSLISKLHLDDELREAGLSGKSTSGDVVAELRRLVNDRAAESLDEIISKMPDDIKRDIGLG